MTEEEWLNCTSVQTMMTYLTEGYTGRSVRKGEYPGLSNRKLRLFAIAYCKLMAETPEGDNDIQFIELAEKYADTGVVQQAPLIIGGRECMRWLFEDPLYSIKRLQRADFANKHAQACDLLRDIIGNPFQVNVQQVHELPPHIISLSQEAYNGDWEALLPLSDALEEWGCDNQVVLNHLRKKRTIIIETPDPECGIPYVHGIESYHTKGCWVLDLILGKV